MWLYLLLGAFIVLVIVCISINKSLRRDIDDMRKYYYSDNALNAYGYQNRMTTEQVREIVSAVIEERDRAIFQKCLNAINQRKNLDDKTERLEQRINASETKVNRLIARYNKLDVYRILKKISEELEWQGVKIIESDLRRKNKNIE